MEMEMINGKWLWKDVTQSKTLDHYEKYGIREIFRCPMHFTNERLQQAMYENDQVAHLIKNNIEMMRVKVGAYISILCHTESIGVQNPKT